MKQFYKISKAWVVTWENWSSCLKKNFVGFFHSKTSGATIKRVIEKIFVNTHCLPSEQIAYMLDNSNHPYPAKFGKLNGVPWEGQITCGHSPYLYARQVKNIQVRTDSDGEETLTWDELERPKVISP